MKSTGILNIFIMALILTGSHNSLSGAPKFDPTIKSQPPSVMALIKREKTTAHGRNILAIAQKIDATYGNLGKRLKDGEKLVIFFDPAHGKLPNGEWQGGKATRRLSCTNFPEEFYSIDLSRRMYQLLDKNPHIEVQSTSDYLRVLRGYSTSYKNIPFTETVRLANKHNAFIIISEHLNNVSVIHKAAGRVNIPGIHITRDNQGRKILKYVRDTYSGFLTLYNKLDASGFSRSYAHNIKNHLTSEGLKANSWEFGAVGDDRFTYFVDFPLSVIYESGFISNPAEERKLREPEYQQTIVDGQYAMLLKTIEDVFSLDISSSTAKQTRGNVNEALELLKLSRIAVYYIKKGKTGQGLRTIRFMEQRYGKGKHTQQLTYFTELKKNILQGEKYYKLGKKYRKKRHYKTSRRYFRKAKKSVGRAPILQAYRNKYNRSLGKQKRAIKRRKSSPKKYRPTKQPVLAKAIKAPRSRTIILTIEENQSLTDALNHALAPNAKTLKRLERSFKNARKVTWKKHRYYSKKKKRRVTTWKKRTRKINFTTGIYLVTLDKRLRVKKAKRVSRVRLDAGKYQNQQYLKNSYFATNQRQKTL